jgi:hypothetical protein
LFYSRKNYKRPELQQEPHRTFADEAALLDAMFHGVWWSYILFNMVSMNSLGLEFRFVRI